MILHSIKSTSHPASLSGIRKIYLLFMSGYGVLLIWSLERYGTQKFFEESGVDPSVMDSTSIAMLVALVALVAMSGYFSATETAFTSLNRIRLKNKADNGDRRAARTLELAEDYDRLLSTILIGNNIVNNVATTIGAVLFIKLIDDVRGPTVSAIVLTVVILIFGEVSPKSLAKENPEGWAMIATPLLRLLVVILTPANFLFTQWKRLLSKVFRTAQGDGITEEELVGMVDQAENEGGLDQHESDLIRNAIECPRSSPPAWIWWLYLTPPPWSRRPLSLWRAATPASPSTTTASTTS